MLLPAYVTLLSVAALLDAGMHWNPDRFVYNVLTLLIVASTLLFRPGLKLLVFLLLAMAVQYGRGFPSLENNQLLSLYFSLAFLSLIGWKLVSKRKLPDGEALLEQTKPLIRISIAMVYVLAGFSKLNSDFFSPDSSCVTSFIDRISWNGFGTFTQIPSALFLLMAGSVVTVELLGGALLFFGPRAQAVSVALMVALHTSFAPAAGADFSALMMSGLFTFLLGSFGKNMAKHMSWNSRTGMPKSVCLYAGINLVSVAFAAFIKTHYFSSYATVALMRNSLFSISLLILAYPFFAAAIRGISVIGAPISLKAVPQPLRLFPAALLFQGMTSYLGLSTAGNFTMFSNLVTENGRTNHLILASQPLKMGDFQDDIVWITKTDPRLHAGKLWGLGLPRVEFNRRLAAFKHTGFQDLKLEVKYKGRTLSYPDLALDPMWGKEDPWGRFLSFRAIQPDGKNQCRW